MARTITNVSPGLNTIQAAITGANDNTNGDEIILADGTYTFSGNNAMIFTSAVTGTTFTALADGSARIVVRGQSRDGVILDFAGTVFDATYCGNAQAVTIQDMTWKGGVSTNASFAYIRDNADSAYVGWTFDNIKIDSPTVNPHTRSAFQLSTNPPGAGLTIKNIVTTANYNGQYVIHILGTNADLNMRIYNIDARLHVTGAMTSAIRLIDVRDVRIDGVQIFKPTGMGLQVQSSDVAKGVYDVDIFNVIADGNSTNTEPLIHIGHNSAYKVTKRVRVHGAIVSNSGSYGIEMEGGVEDSEIVNCRVTNVTNHAIPIPDSNRNLLISDNTIDTVSGALNSGVAMVCGRRHRVYRNVISNCYSGIRHDENGDVGQAADGVNVLDNQLNVVRDNIIYNVSYAYRVTANSMPPNAAGAHPVGAEAASLANQFGPNTIYTPTVAFCQIDSVDKTKAEFEAAFPKSIAVSDTVLSSTTPAAGTQYTTQQALNMLAGNTTAPYTAWSTQKAANMLIGNTAGNPNKFSTQYVTNVLA